MNVLGIIPARYGSSRFPGKPLVDMLGKSMIQRVYEQVSLSKSLKEVVVATDDQRIFDEVVAFGGKAVMTSVRHKSGTDRCLEALESVGGNFDGIINIQGDEPLIDPGQIDALAKCLKNKDADLATLVRKAKTSEELFNANRVKVVLNSSGRAMYFSRQVIPFVKGKEEEEWINHMDYYLHIGIYAYKTKALSKVCKLNSSLLEEAESLEQLRWLENGFSIQTAMTDHDSPGIDTPEDLGKVLEIMRSGDLRK